MLEDILFKNTISNTKYISITAQKVLCNTFAFTALIPIDVQHGSDLRQVELGMRNWYTEKTYYFFTFYTNR